MDCLGRVQVNSLEDNLIVDKSCYYILRQIIKGNKLDTYVI